MTWGIKARRLPPRSVVTVTMGNYLVQARQAEVAWQEVEERLLAEGWTRDALGWVSPDGKTRMDR